MRPALLAEIGVGAARGEIGMMPQSRADRPDIDLLDSGHRHDDVRDAAVDITGVNFFPADSDFEPEPEIVRLAHLERDQFADELRADHPGGGFEGQLLERTRRPVGVAREAAGAVAAHFRFAAVGIVVAHAEIGAVRGTFQEEHAVGPDPAMAIADARDLFAGQLEVAHPIVEQDEIVAGAVHFRETQHVMAG